MKSLEDSKLNTGRTLEVTPQRRRYKVEVVGDVATFTPQKGDAYRDNILQGNAKNL